MAIDLLSLAEQLRGSDEYRVYRRFHPRRDWPTATPANTRRAILVDVETTGLAPEKNVIIQLAITPFEYTPDGMIVRADPCQTWLEDPGHPLDPKISRLTGLTDADVAGQRIDDEAVAAIVNAAVLVIAHNAGFDRVFLEKRLSVFADKHWACSQKDVDWEAEGMTSQKLEFLVERLCGKFYQAHDATEDCEILVELLSTKVPSQGRPVLAAILESGRQPRVRLWATGAPYDNKDALKDRDYHWFAGSASKEKAWHRDLPREQLATELEWLKATVYNGMDGNVLVADVRPTVRFSSRVDELPTERIQLPT